MNYWRQTNHIMQYFQGENYQGAKKLPSNFMEGFLEVSLGNHWVNTVDGRHSSRLNTTRAATKRDLGCFEESLSSVYVYKQQKKTQDPESSQPILFSDPPPIRQTSPKFLEHL